MERRNFLRNALMAIAVSLLPKILQPCVPEIVEEEMFDVHVQINWVVYGEGIGVKPSPEPTQHIFRLSKSQYETFKSQFNG